MPRGGRGLRKVKKCERSSAHKANIPATKNTVGFAPFSKTPFFPPLPFSLRRRHRRRRRQLPPLPPHVILFTSPFLLENSSPRLSDPLFPATSLLRSFFPHPHPRSFSRELLLVRAVKENSHLPTRLGDGKLKLPPRQKGLSLCGVSLARGRG